jgi:hypothetical protein
MTDLNQEGPQEIKFSEILITKNEISLIVLKALIIYLEIVYSIFKHPKQTNK